MGKEIVGIINWLTKHSFQQIFPNKLAIWESNFYTELK